MKRRVVVALILLCFSVSACGNEAGNKGSEPTVNQETEEKQNPDSEEESKETPEEEEKETEEKQEEKTLGAIELHMLNSGVLSGEKTQMVADMIGAINGFKYADSNVEVYEYDTSSEEYIALSNGKEIALKGMDGFTCKATAINGKFVLFGEPSQDAIDSFNSFE